MVNNSLVLGLVFLPLGVSFLTFWGLVNLTFGVFDFSRLGVSNCYVFGFSFLTFGG